MQTTNSRPPQSWHDPPPPLRWAICSGWSHTMKCDYVKTCQLHPHTTHTQFMCSAPSLLSILRGGEGKHELHIHQAHHTSRLTRRDEGVLDCIAFDEVTLHAVCTMNDVPIKSLHTAHSTDCHSVLCITLDCVQCTREGSGKELTPLCCPIVYPVWVSENITVSTDEGKLVWTVSSLELQGNVEGSCERKYTRTVASRGSAFNYGDYIYGIYSALVQGLLSN